MNTLFNDDVDNTPVIDPSKNYLEELVGPDKKFKTIEELARGKMESDTYIKTIEKRSDDLRGEYLKMRDEATAKAKLQDLIDQLETKRLTSNDTPQVNEVQREPEYDPEQIATLVSDKIKEHELTKKQTDNFNQVMDKLKDSYGVNYQNILRDQMNTLGLTAEDIDALARKSPAAFFRTLGLDKPAQTENFNAPPRSNQRRDTFAPRTEKRTWTYYQNLKATDPKKYFDPKTTVQMHQDYAALGDSFEDGDFNAFG